MPGDDRLKPEAFVQLADQNQTGIGGDARSLKRDLQKAVEGELKRLGFFVTHRVSPFVVGVPRVRAQGIKARRLFCGGEYHDQIGNPGREEPLVPKTDLLQGTSVSYHPPKVATDAAMLSSSWPFHDARGSTQWRQ